MLSDIGFDFGWSCVGSGVGVDDPCGFFPTWGILWFWVCDWQVVLCWIKQNGRESKHWPLIVALFVQKPVKKSWRQQRESIRLGEEHGARSEACHCRRVAGMDIFHSYSVDRKIHHCDSCSHVWVSNVNLLTCVQGPRAELATTHLTYALCNLEGHI